MGHLKNKRGQEKNFWFLCNNPRRRLQHRGGDPSRERARERSTHSFIFGIVSLQQLDVLICTQSAESLGTAGGIDAGRFLFLFFSFLFETFGCISVGTRECPTLHVYAMLEYFLYTNVFIVPPDFLGQEGP